MSSSPPVPFIDLKRLEPGFHEALMDKFHRMTRNAEFVGGAEVATLEARLQTELEVVHVIGCANGTDAIQLALRAAGVGAGDLVPVPNVTFWATFEAVVNVGARPVTIDADPYDGGVCFDAFARCLRKIRPKAALIAHLYGWGSGRINELRTMCRSMGVVLIEDGAQAFGVRYDGSPIFKGAHLSTTSFYPAKVLGAAGDGGAVFTNDEELATRVRRMGNHGRASHYGHADVGWNSRLDALQAAFLNLSLDQVQARIASRRNAAAYYREHLARTALEIMNPPQGYLENGYCNVCMVRNQNLKANLESRLRAAGIGFGNIYPGVMSRQSGAASYVGGHFGAQAGEALCASVLNLPLFPYMTEAELERVVAVVTSTLEDAHAA